MEKNKKKWKPGQLVTINNIVYRVVKYDFKHIPCTEVCDNNCNGCYLRLSGSNSMDMLGCVGRMGFDRCLKRI